MIDAELAIYDELINRLQEKYAWAENGKVGFSNEYVPQPEKFPWVTIIEEDNRTEERFHSSSNEENAVRLTYQVDVYTNNGVNRKRDARRIMDAVDTEMISLGFRRTYLNNVPDYGDVSIYRLIGRYTAIVEEDESDFIVYHRP